MTVPSAGMITAVTLNGDCNAQRLMNTVHYRMTAAYESTSIDAYYTNLHNALKITGPYDIVTSYLALMASNYTLDTLRIQVVYPVRFKAKSFTQGGVGSRTEVCEVQNVTGVMTKQCELSGRSKIGSMHLGALSILDYVAGFVTGPQRARMATLADKLLVPIFETDGAGLNTPIIYHPGANANPKYDLITNWIVQETVRTQRTRNIGKGV